MACFRAVSNCFLLILGLAVWGAGPAWADVDKAGAQKLKAVVEKAIGEWTEYAAAHGRALELDGPVMVEPSGTYYAVTLPGLKFGDMDGARVEMGMVAINAMPGAKDGQWKMTVALPTPLSHFDENQRLSALTTIGGQNFAGIWDEGVGSFIKMNASYQNIVQMTPERKPYLTVKAATLDNDMSENDKGFWSGLGVLELREVAWEKDKARGSLSRMVVSTTTKDYSAKAARDYEENLNALNEYAGAGAGMSMDHALGLYNLIGGFLGKVMDGFDVNVKLENIAMSQPGKAGAQERVSAVNSLAFAFGMQGFHSDKVALRLNLDYDGMQGLTTRDGDSKAIPGKTHFDLSLNNLPYQALFELGQKSLRMTASAPQEEVAKLAALNALMTVPQLLTQAGSNLAIKDSFLRNQAYEIFVDGKAVADMKAQLSATGAAVLRIRGLDNLIEITRGKVAAAKSENAKARLQKTIVFLTMMQISGTKTAGADGTTTHEYNFELGADGKMLVNGADLSVLLKN